MALRSIQRSWVLAAYVAAACTAVAQPIPPTEDSPQSLAVWDGTVAVQISRTALADFGWSFASRGVGDGDGREPYAATFPIDPQSTVRLEAIDGRFRGFSGGTFQTTGGILLADSQQRWVIGDFIVHPHEDATWTVTSTLGAPGIADEVFKLPTVRIDYSAQTRRLRIVAELAITPSWARLIGRPEEADRIIGTLVLDASLRPAAIQEGEDADPNPAARSRSIGPDIIVGSLHDVHSYGEDLFGNISAFSVGTISCNQGDEPASWYALTNQHPVIAQNMYRLKDHRFEQIGASWVKHGFATVDGNTCSFGCTPPPDRGNQLGVGCSDPYSAGLNGQQNNLGPRSVVNADTGYFPYPYSAPDPENTIGRRIQVDNTDLQPSLNIGALYFVEGHYVTADDAAAGNQDNNASYRRITVQSSLDGYSIALTSSTAWRSPAIRAWENLDPPVTETDIEVPNEGLFLVAAKTTDLENGTWHYEYAVHNLNSDRAAGSFSVPIGEGTTVTNIGFHDIDYHSGDPYDGTDWTPQIADGQITWSTTPFDQAPQGNALRWGTLYNFRFDADRPPTNTIATLGLFKPGLPASIYGSTRGPAEVAAVCGNETVETGEDCDPPNGVTCDEECHRIPTCGDGIVDEGETCDPPDGLTCDITCLVVDSEFCSSAARACPGTITGTTSGASTDGSVSCGDASESSSVWYWYQPRYDGVATIETCGSVFDTVLSVHSECPGHTANELDCDDDSCARQSRIVLSVSANETYIIRVSGFQGDQGAFVLSIDGPDCVPRPPPNDSCAAAITVSDALITFLTTDATTDGPTNAGDCDPQDDVWYCYQATCSGTATADLCSSTFDTSIAVYEGCVCPTAPSIGCNDDDATCGPQSRTSFPTILGQSYLMRIGGQGGETGVGQMRIECVGGGDAVRGGKLWDKWWTVNGATTPSGDHPLYPPAGAQSGATTHRCKECHGWDYKGVDGAYAGGTHFTGIGGVLGSTLTAVEMFDLTGGASVPIGHGFGAAGLSDQDIWDIVAFLRTLVIDTDLYIDGTGTFVGNSLQGETDYLTGGSPACVTCHGVDGAAINFGTPEDPVFVGTIADDNPWELLHKIRFGQPGSVMPSWLGNGGSDQGAANIGLHAQLDLPSSCVIDAHCDDGAFCNGIEQCADGLCQAGIAPCINQACNETIDDCEQPDAIRGGLLWDKWWVVGGAGTPVGVHPLYPPEGPQSGTDTFRCKECHGWDYKGADGPYGSGPHFTGISGVLGTTLSETELFDLIQGNALPFGHGFAALGLEERDAWDLVAFLGDGAIDTDSFIDETGSFVGDPVQGEDNYLNGYVPSCAACHGLDGTNLNFGTNDDPEWVGTIAMHNPWKLIHKIRFGQPGASMPSWLAEGGSNQGAADTGLYAQLTFPIDCLTDPHCINEDYCDGVEACDGRFCIAGIDPCPGLACDDSIDTCLSGTCAMPAAVAQGCRYLEVTPAPGSDPVALMVTGMSGDPDVTCMQQYVQSDGTLAPTAQFRNPTDWGTVFVHGPEVIPSATYSVRTDCSDVGDLDLSFAAVDETFRWGDVNDDDFVTFLDIQLIVRAFQEDYSLVTIQRADLADCGPNGVVNFADIQTGVQAFQAEPFDTLGCGAPCP